MDEQEPAEQPVDPQPEGEGEGEEVKEEKEIQKSPEELKYEELKNILEARAAKPSPKKYGIKTSFQLGSDDGKKEVFSLAYDFDDKYLAAAVGDGTICVYNMVNSKLASTIQYSNPNTGDTARAMCVKWRRMDYLNEVGSKRKQAMILACFSDGTINEYISPVGKLNSTIIEEGNQIFVLDVDPFEEKFCSAGKDYRVRVYDCETKDLIVKMLPVVSTEPGHAQRIFAMKYKRDDPNCVITGGWDKTLQIHDIREGGPVGYIFGPDLSSNSIDIYDNMIVTGSHRSKNPLQTWDIRKKELIQTLEWDYSGEASENSYLNCCGFTHSGDKILGGGKGEEIKFFDRMEADDGYDEYHAHGKITDFKDSILCCGFANNNNDFAVGTADGAIKIFTSSVKF